MKVILFILSFSDIRLEDLKICPIGLVSAVKVQVQSIFPSSLSLLFLSSSLLQSIPFHSIHLYGQRTILHQLQIERF